MIEVEKALDHLAKIARRGNVVSLPIEKSLGHTLAKEIASPIDMPPFNQSAMDGYAINMSDSSITYTVIGEINAGSSLNPILQKGEAVRIFTGAPVPRSANTVIQQEWAIKEDHLIRFNQDIETGKNIRLKGEQIKKGTSALKKGQVINPATIGFLATLGITDIAVFERPKIGLVITGNELIKPGIQLEYGQIYESNGPMLMAAFSNLGIQVEMIYLKDDYEQTKSALKKALNHFDIIVSSGGISVGDYDFIGKAYNELGVHEIFYKVKQKPGKPLYVGQKDKSICIALPGNPAAALTCFYIYLTPLINFFIGNDFSGLNKKLAKLSGDYNRNGDRAHFLKGFYDGQVHVLPNQSSAMLNDFAQANCIIYIPSNVDHVKNGEDVIIYQI